MLEGKVGSAYVSFPVQSLFIKFVLISKAFYGRGRTVFLVQLEFFKQVFHFKLLKNSRFENGGKYCISVTRIFFNSFFIKDKISKNPRKVK